jgi:hypothetical protein
VPRVPLCGDFAGSQAAPGARSSESTANHLTELLDFFGQCSYSATQLAPADARLECKGAPPKVRPPQPQGRDRAAGSRSSECRPVAACLKKRPRSRSRGRFIFRRMPGDPQERIPRRANPKGRLRLPASITSVAVGSLAVPGTYQFLGRSERMSLSPGSEATLQGSWRGSGSALADPEPDCALSQNRSASGGVRWRCG